MTPSHLKSPTGQVTAVRGAAASAAKRPEANGRPLRTSPTTLTSPISGAQGPVLLVTEPDLAPALTPTPASEMLDESVASAGENKGGYAADIARPGPGKARPKHEGKGATDRGGARVAGGKPSSADSSRRGSSMGRAAGGIWAENLSCPITYALDTGEGQSDLPGHDCLTISRSGAWSTRPPGETRHPAINGSCCWW